MEFERRNGKGVVVVAMVMMLISVEDDISRNASGKTALTPPAFDKMVQPVIMISA